MLYKEEDINGTLITGASDDLIELYGEIEEEYSSYDCKDGVLALSDGTLLSVKYDDHGLWRFTPLTKGMLFERIEYGDIEADTNDKVFIKQGLKWVVFSEEKATFAS